MQNSKQQRRGSLYIAVLGTSVIVSMMALAAMHQARMHFASTQKAADRHQARLLASSAIEHAVALFNSDASWLDNYTLDTDYPATPVAAGGGVFTWRLTGAGGLNRTLSGAGVAGDATCTLTVDLAQPPDLDCALLAEGDVTVNSGCELICNDAPVGTNGAYSNQGDTDADVEAQSISGAGAISGAQTTPGALRVLPEPSMVFDYYEKHGTTITPDVSYGVTRLRYELLSPSESIGDTNADGIYVIDTQGNDLLIQFSRIVGTLVVTNLAPGKKVTIAGDVNWEPAYPNYPALLVDGDVVIATSHDGMLNEHYSSPNYNPRGAPYQGHADYLRNDDYISSVAGIIYCTGDLTFDGADPSDPYPDIRGLVIAGGDCTLQDQIFPTIQYDSVIATNPPPGFGGTEPDIESAVTLLRSYAGSGSNDELMKDKCWAQYLKPTNLPAEAMSWRVTRVEFYCSKVDDDCGFKAVLYEPGGDNMPSSAVIDLVSANSSDLSSSWSWQSVDFTGGATIPTDEGVCIALTTTENDKPLAISYLSGGVSAADSALITGNPSWNTLETDKALLCRVYGVYTTAAGVPKPVVIVPGSWRQVSTD